MLDNRRELRSIDWAKRPKWLTEERLYTLACADLSNKKKVFILRVLASCDVANMKSIDAPQIGKLEQILNTLLINVHNFK